MLRKQRKATLRGYVQAGSKEEYTAIYYERGTGIHADPKRSPEITTFGEAGILAKLSREEKETYGMTLAEANTLEQTG